MADHKEISKDGPEERCQYCRRVIEPGQVCTVESHAGDYMPCEPTPQSAPVDVEAADRCLYCFHPIEDPCQQCDSQGQPEAICEYAGSTIAAFAQAHTEEAVKVERERADRVLVKMHDDVHRAIDALRKSTESG